ncbi:hypothetical protein [Megalodesulfovibrio paquesii]
MRFLALPFGLRSLVRSGLLAAALLLCAALPPVSAQTAAPGAADDSSLLAMGGSPQMSLSTFRHRCNMFDGPASSGINNNQCGPGDQDAICVAFSDMLSAGYPGQDQCIRQCSALRAQLSPRYIFNGCQYVLDNAYSVCSRYCRANPAPAPAGS